MTREQAYKFLSDLADECERSGLEYGKGRANGIREAVKELWPLIEAADEIERLRAALDVAMREVRGWRDHAEDSHDTNYGFCRPGCSKCELRRKAWKIAENTDANPLCAAAMERVRKDGT